jgi:hypothetical protein
MQSIHAYKHKQEVCYKKQFNPFRTAFLVKISVVESISQYDSVIFLVLPPDCTHVQTLLCCRLHSTTTKTDMLWPH